MSAKSPRRRGAGKAKPGGRTKPAGGGRPGAGRASGASSPVEAPRLNKLEESTAYNERAVEELTAQMLDLDLRLRRLMTRLEGLESRIVRPPQPGDEGPDGAEVARPSGP